VAIGGTSWLRFGRRITVTVGEPLAVAGRPNRETVDRLTAACWAALHALVVRHRDEPPPGPIGRWVTEAFNDWPEGARPAIDLDAPPSPDATA
jgi:hypothetical protein